MYCNVSLSLRKSLGVVHLPQHTSCRLEKFEKLPGIAEGLDGVMHEMSAFKYEVIVDPYTIQP